MIVAAPDYEAWRAACRGLLAAGVPPADVLFADGTESGLFAADDPPAVGAGVEVPRRFAELAEAVACHRDGQRWARLYRAVWRLTRGEPHLLDLATDPDVSWLLAAERSVRRDSHKMKAFVRFRKVGEHFVAWHRPDHRIVRRTAPFFARRFPEMHWTILTPDESATWDGSALHFGPGVPAKAAPPPDVLEDLWRAYYRATFNPARVRVRAMKKELPVRHWPTLPEAADIPALVAAAASLADAEPQSPVRGVQNMRDFQGFLRRQDGWGVFLVPFLPRAPLFPFHFPSGGHRRKVPAFSTVTPPDFDSPRGDCRLLGCGRTEALQAPLEVTRFPLTRPSRHCSVSTKASADPLVGHGFRRAFFAPAGGSSGGSSSFASDSGRDWISRVT